MDQAIYEFEQKSIIFNQKQDLLFVECSSQARIDDLEVLRAMLRGSYPNSGVDGSGINLTLLLMPEKMYQTKITDLRKGIEHLVSQLVKERMIEID